MAIKQAKDIVEGDLVRDRGKTFTVKKIITIKETGHISFLDEDNNFHGFYNPEEFLTVGVD